MTFAELKEAYNERYNVEAYANDDDTLTMLALIEKGEVLSPNAKNEFVKAFDFEHALYGELYLGGKRSANHRFPHLIAEADAAGITIVIR